MSNQHDIAHQLINQRLTALDGAPLPLQPIVLVTKPQFVAAGAVLKLAVSTTAVPGTYNNGTIVSRRRVRIVAGVEEDAFAGAGTTYIPVSDDVGRTMRIYETVNNPATGETKTFASDAVGPILDADPTPSGILESFDFTGTPSGVTVARSGSLATARSGASTVATYAANTIRYEYSAAGAKLGALIEKARTNHFTNADNPGAVMTASSGVTKTSNYGTAPDGTTSSTRIQYAGGAGSIGLILGTAGITAKAKMGVWLKSAVLLEFVITHPNDGSFDYHEHSGDNTWKFFEIQGTVTPPSNFLNVRLFNSGTGALNCEIWGFGVQTGGSTGMNSLVLTAGTSQTNAKDVYTFNLATGSVTRDIQVVDHLGQTQNFESQVIPAGTDWVLDADDLNDNMAAIALVAVYAEGEIGTTPPPAPEPPPPPPPPGGGTNFGIGVMCGDSLNRGSAGVYVSPMQELDTLLRAAGHTIDWEGTHLASPGNIPVEANGGWKIADLNAATIAGFNPDTVIISIGTNDVNVTSDIGAAITAKLDAIEAACTTAERFFVFCPPQLAHFTGLSWTALYFAMEAWVLEDTSKRFLSNLNDAGLNAFDFTDGTHYTDSGADKIALLSSQRMHATTGAGPGPAPAPPPSAPPPSGDYPEIDVEDLIDFMEGEDDMPAFVQEAGSLGRQQDAVRLPAKEANVQTPCNQAGLTYLCNYGGQEWTNFDELWARIATWLWLYRGIGLPANKRIQYRRQIMSVKRGSTGQWVDSAVHEQLEGVIWNGPNGGGGAHGHITRSEAGNGGGYSVKLTGSQGVELWQKPNFMSIDNARSLLLDTVAGAAIAEIRVINEDGTEYNGSDAIVVAAMGWDPYSLGDVWRNANLSTAGASMLDGMKGRWKAVNCSAGWQPVACISYSECFKKDGPRPPWGNYTGSWAVTGALYNLTPAQVRAGDVPYWVTGV